MAEQVSLQRIESLSQFIVAVEARKLAVGAVRFFRGHDSPNHILTPSLFRNSKDRKSEKNLLRELLSMQPSEFADDKGVFEQLVRMQHYSLKTRVLDITSNPMVALYFSCATRPSMDGELIRLTASERSIKYFDSDTVSCLANLANLSGSERDQIRRTSTDIMLRDSSGGKRLLQFIKSEKPYFLPEIRRDDLSGPLIVKPRLTNRRLLAQQGAFLLFGLRSNLQDENESDIDIARFKVPSGKKKAILDSLDRVGINRSTMFPEIDSAARYIMDKIVPASDQEHG